KPDDSVFGAWHDLSKLSAKTFAEEAAAVLEKLGQAAGSAEKPSQPVNRLVLEALTREPPRSMYEVARIYGKLLADVHREWQALQTSPKADGAASDQLADPAAEELRLVLYG